MVTTTQYILQEDSMSDGDNNAIHTTEDSMSDGDNNTIHYYRRFNV